MLRGVIAFVIVLAAACAAESITMPEDKIPQVITLVQEEPEYHENTDIVGQENAVNVQKFSNPATESEPLNRETVSSSSYVQHSETTHTDGLPVERLTKSKGIHQGPSGLESWYDLPMGGVVKIMRDAGFSEEEYPYWVREDGCKMLGDCIMVATCFDIRPRGTVVETSLGIGLACDTGSFAKSNPTQIDIAVSWGN